MNKLKYEYGVEYETNGEKPDLPDYVLVVFKNTRGNQGKCRAEDVYWHNCKLFRIVDERWKPKPNDWYKRGELPPVGTECLAAFLPNEVMAKDERVDDGHCLIRGYNGNMVWLQWWRGDNFVNRIDNFEFSPFRTERDVLVGECVKALGAGALSGEVKSIRDQAELLVDKGWRPVKQQTEAEFVNYIEERQGALYPVDEECAKKLYRAGCRFVGVSDE